MEKTTPPARAVVTSPAPSRLRGADRENFPVASRLLPAPLRPSVRAFYEVVRAADDVADDPHLAAPEKHARLDAIEAGLRGGPGPGHTADLRAALAAAGQPGLERHAIAMLAAFRADVAATPCADWAALRGYCRASADPVGRFLLDLHGEAEADRAASDALCTALQLLNHLQDLGEDRRDLGRIYLPADWIADAGASPADLDRDRLTPALRRALDRALDEADALLAHAARLPATIRSRRLRAEVSVILALARGLSRRLRHADPLKARVAPARPDHARAALAGLAALLIPARKGGAS